VNHHASFFSRSILFTNLLVTLSLAQSPASLTIVSPSAAGAIQAGKALEISVQVAAGKFPNGVAIIGQDPLGATGPNAVVGSTVSFTITPSADTPPGPYEITAVGIDSTGTFASSKPLTVDVERADIPATVSVDPASVSFRYAGDTFPLTVIGTFPGGKYADLTHSTKLIFSSENTSVVVAKSDILTAVGVGQTEVDVQYGTIMVKIRVTVEASAR
jgi:hypothetical protein